MKEFAKKVYSFDLGRTIDRTTEYQPDKKKFDIDFRAPKAENPEAREWTYGGSRNTIETAEKDADKLLELRQITETRIVDSFTGEVLKKKFREVA